MSKINIILLLELIVIVLTMVSIIISKFVKKENSTIILNNSNPLRHTVRNNNKYIPDIIYCNTLYLRVINNDIHNLNISTTKDFNILQFINPTPNYFNGSVKIGCHFNNELNNKIGKNDLIYISPVIWLPNDIDIIFKYADKYNNQYKQILKIRLEKNIVELNITKRKILLWSTIKNKMKNKERVT